MAPVDLGQIDLLVREGFYQNRTDFIRTAIRNQLGAHAEAVRQAVSREELVLGLARYARRDLEAVRAAGETLQIVLGRAVRRWGDGRGPRGEAYPDLYDAIGVHSGLAPRTAHDLAFAAMRQGGPATARRDAAPSEPTRIVPAILFHGDRDSTVHPSNAERLLAHYRAAANDALRVTTRRGQVPGSYTDPRWPDASAQMVRFFQQHPRRESGGRPIDRRSPRPSGVVCWRGSRRWVLVSMETPL